MSGDVSGNDVMVGVPHLPGSELRWASSNTTTVREKRPRRRDEDHTSWRQLSLAPLPFSSSRWKKQQQQQEQQQQQQQENYYSGRVDSTSQGSIPKARLCNVEFPSSSRFNDSARIPFLTGGTASSSSSFRPFSMNGTNNGNSNTYVSVGGVIPLDSSVPLLHATTTEERLFGQSGRHVPRPEARVVHPQGFRILKSNSAVERPLRSYFRLPPAPSARLHEERMQTQRQLMAMEAIEDANEERFFGAVMDGSLHQPRILLDGFMLLCAGGQPEPEAVEAVTLECSHLVGVIEEDLTHFQNLRFLDVSENELLLEHLLSLTSLEVVHLAYNNIKSLAGITRVVAEQQQRPANSSSLYATRNGFRGCGVGAAQTGRAHDSKSIRSAAAYYAQGKPTTTANQSDDKFDSYAPTRTKKNSSDISEVECPGYYSPHQKVLGCHQASECSLHDVLLPNLHALNLSFNMIPPGDILHLSYFPCLEKLDLSGNNLRTLPEDLADLTGVTHFALERNSFQDGKAIFASLSTMPALVEVNLNHNKLHYVPPLSVKDGRGLCFPSIEVIGLGFNCFETVRDIAALSELVRTLQRVMLAGNPIARKRRERSAAQSLFATAVMDLYWEQAAVRHPENRQMNSTSGMGRDGPLGDSSMLHSEREDNESDERELTVGESHGWCSPISSWRKDRQEAESRTSHYNTESYEVGEGDADFNAHDTAEKPDTPFITISQTDGSTNNNTFWYDDADPLPSQGTQTMGDDHILPELPTPLLRFVELVFDDAVMPKQKLGYFYSKQRQAAIGDPTQRSPLVHPKTGLVTVPNYTEFMNIYRLIGEHPLSRRGVWRRQYATARERRPRQKFDIRVPQQTDDDAEKEEEIATPEPIPQQTTEMGGLEEEEEEEEEEEMDESSLVEGVSPHDVVFMTGVALQVERETSHKRKKKAKRRASQVQVHESPLTEDFSESMKERTELDGEEKERAEKKEEAHNLDHDAADAKEKKAKIQVNQEMKKPERPQDGYPRRRKQQPSLSGAQEPPSTNVRVLMNELRRMLRRPLPPLPSGSRK